MSAETLDLQPIAEDKGASFIALSHPILEDFLLTTLEQLDGFCLDNETDREALDPLPINALFQVTQSGVLVLSPFPLEPDPPQETSGNSAGYPAR